MVFYFIGVIGLLYSMFCEFLFIDVLIKFWEMVLFICFIFEESVDCFLVYVDIIVMGGCFNVCSVMNLLSDVCGGSMGDLGLFNIYFNLVWD